MSTSLITRNNESESKMKTKVTKVSRDNSFYSAPSSLYESARNSSNSTRQSTVTRSLVPSLTKTKKTLKKSNSSNGNTLRKLFQEPSNTKYLSTVRTLSRRKRNTNVNLSDTFMYRTDRTVKETFEELEDIINDEVKHKLEPTIVNPDSKFVVITYYWGGDNLNMNTQQPCDEFYRELRKENKERIKRGLEPKKIPPIKKKAISFNKMIENWKQNMRDVGCNFLVEEYPEFAKPGGYQLAINAKPLFIKKALEACGNRAVVYIDGDMTIHRYPHLFDIKNVDYMARGWNIDPRASDNYSNEELPMNERVCYDNYIFETSGGIMYFGNTNGAYEILRKFINMSKKEQNKGKADDRIVSLLFNSYNMFSRYNIIQLPIEYLWLSDYYHEYIPRKDYGQIVVDHPACLTSEDTARDQGAAANREPKFYNTLVANNINCNSHGGIFYEYIFFEDVGEQYEEAAKTYSVYLNILKNLHTQYKENIQANLPIIYHIPMLKNIKKTINKETKKTLEFQILQQYGKEHGINAKENIKLSLRYKNGVISSNSSNDVLINKLNSVKFVRGREEHYIPKILAALSEGYDVMYLPNNMHNSISKELIYSMILNKPNDIELMAFIDTDYEWNNMEQYQPSIHIDKPILFSAKSRVLYHLIALCRNITTDLNTHFNSSFIFLTRIRCKWLDPDFTDDKDRIFKKVNHKYSLLLDLKYNPIMGKRTRSVSRKTHARTLSR